MFEFGVFFFDLLVIFVVEDFVLVDIVIFNLELVCGFIIVVGGLISYIVILVF